MFKIRFTVEAEKQLLNLQTSKDKQVRFKAVGKALAFMNVNLRHPSQYKNFTECNFFGASLLDFFRNWTFGQI